MSCVQSHRTKSKYIAYSTGKLLLCLLIIVTLGCASKDKASSSSSGNDVWDIDKNGIPKFVATDYIELAGIYRISKYRSSIGHDYSDAFEHCRSMKHYYEPLSGIDCATIRIFSPVTGVITRVDQEWAGTKLEIASDTYPAFRFSIFHIYVPIVPAINDKVQAGQQLGTHIGSQTMSDIAVMVNDATRQGRMVSYFEVMTDAVFAEYAKRGVSSRDTMIISKQLRDLNPLTCAGDTFLTTDTLENWVVLQ